MATWDNIDLTHFNKLHLDELIPDHKYILSSNSPSFYPESRWLMVFKNRVNETLIHVVIVAEYNKHFGLEKEVNEYARFGTSSWDIYDYDAIFNRAIKKDISSLKQNEPARLSVLAAHQLPTKDISYVNQMGMLGVSSGKTGGKRRKSRNRSTREKRMKARKTKKGSK
jgi:hypothetical protein